MMNDGAIQVPEALALVSLPGQYQHLAKAVLAERAGGVLTVEFIVGGGFPTKHSGYLYRSSGPLEGWALAKRWPRQSHIDQHWYRVSD
jgi:hypothetical protein